MERKKEDKGKGRMSSEGVSKGYKEGEREEKRESLLVAYKGDSLDNFYNLFLVIYHLHL